MTIVCCDKYDCTYNDDGACDADMIDITVLECETYNHWNDDEYQYVSQAEMRGERE